MNNYKKFFITVLFLIITPLANAMNFARFAPKVARAIGLVSTFAPLARYEYEKSVIENRLIKSSDDLNAEEERDVQDIIRECKINQPIILKKMPYDNYIYTFKPNDKQYILLGETFTNQHLKKHIIKIGCGHIHHNDALKRQTLIISSNLGAMYLLTKFQNNFFKATSISSFTGSLLFNIPKLLVIFYSTKAITARYSQYEAFKADQFACTYGTKEELVEAEKHLINHYNERFSKLPDKRKLLLSIFGFYPCPLKRAKKIKAYRIKKYGYDSEDSRDN